MENLLNLPQFGRELLLTSGLASYLAALLNQPKWPSWLKLLVVFAVSGVAAAIQELMHPREGVDRWARVGMVFFSALLLYNNLLKGLGADWLTNAVTPDAIRGLLQKMIDPTLGASSSSTTPTISTVYDQIKQLEELKEILPADAYRAKLDDLLKGI